MLCIPNSPSHNLQHRLLMESREYFFSVLLHSLSLFYPLFLFPLIKLSLSKHMSFVLLFPFFPAYFLRPLF